MASVGASGLYKLFLPRVVTDHEFFVPRYLRSLFYLDARTIRLEGEGKYKSKFMDSSRDPSCG